MERRVLELIAGCTLADGASDNVLDELSEAVGIRLPSDYLSLLSYTNGLSGFVGENYVTLFSAEQIRAHGVYEQASFFIFIGSDGGGEGFAYDTRSPEMPIVNVPFIGMTSETPRPLGKSILGFLERLHAKPLFE
jgi:hypothetical protein